MNVYDFDGTIYRGDSSLDFYLFSLRSHPGLIRFLPRQAAGVLAYKLGLLSKERGKELFFSFLRGIHDIDGCVQRFWQRNSRRIEPWYLAQKKEDDVVISASPHFLLMPICRELSITLIASSVNAGNGKFLTPNCYGAEKKRRFENTFGTGSVIDSFYSDSYSDAPLAALAEKRFMVKKGNIYKWNERNRP